jgi:hypothetical protein
MKPTPMLTRWAISGEICRGNTSTVDEYSWWDEPGPCWLFLVGIGTASSLATHLSRSRASCCCEPISFSSNVGFIWLLRIFPLVPRVGDRVGNASVHWATDALKMSVWNTEAAAATASIAAAHIAEPVLARAAEYMIPVAGEALTISQGLLALSDADKAYWICLNR